MTKFNFLRAFSLALLLFGLSGCGFIDYYFLPPPDDTAQELWEAGREAMKEKRYTEAQEFFLKLKDHYPFSPYTPDGIIGLGDAYFMDDKFAPAADSYKEFESLHPRHEQIPYVLYQIGVSTYRKLESIDLPQDGLQEAIQYFTLLRDTYPDTQWGKDAGNWVVKCRTRMADHEIFIADFYWNTERFGAAWRRYMYVAENFKDLPDIVKYSKDKAQLSYLAYQKTLSEEERRKVEGSWRNFMKKWL
jgi:outer membrane protein assembly factor BamD